MVASSSATVVEVRSKVPDEKLLVYLSRIFLSFGITLADNMQEGEMWGILTKISFVPNYFVKWKVGFRFPAEKVYRRDP